MDRTTRTEIQRIAAATLRDAGVEINAEGSRFLDKRNRTPARGFATLAAAGGYRTARWEIRVAGRNLGDRRDPVSESELGDAQYYLMPGRRLDLSFSVKVTR